MDLRATVLAFICLSSVSYLRATNTYKSNVNVVSMEINGSKSELDRIDNQVPTLTLDILSLRQKSVINEDETMNIDRAGSHVTDTLSQEPVFNRSSDFDVVVDLQHGVSTTEPKFVGVTIDSEIFRDAWKRLDVHSKKLESLVKAIAPSWLRVGGTYADFFIFDPSLNPVELPGNDQAYADENESSDYDVDNPAIKNYTVTGEEWERLNYLVKTAGWDLIFDFNEFLRKDGQWDPDNARKLLTFSQQRNYSIPVFQMGNEPNSYYHNFHFEIPPLQLARDMQMLRQLLSEFPAYRNSSIVGPDVTKVTSKSSRTYFQEFLQKGGQTVVSAATLHHYYFNAKLENASWSNFINTTILDSLNEELSIGTSVSHSSAPGLPVWLSETSSVSGGGLKGVSTSYVAGFMWLDKLGLSALYGLKSVLRQSLINGNYALMSADFTPYPDYFLTLLYKRLVQGTVFNVTSSTDKVRIYASCTNPMLHARGALTLYALNVQDRPTTLNISQFSNLLHEVYILTPGDHNDLRSASVALNGVKLEMVGTQLPPLPPLIQPGPVTFPPYSFGFIVIPQAGVDLCKNI